MRVCLLLAVVGASFCSPALAQQPADSAADLARQVAQAAGLDAWERVGVLRFSFVFAPKNVERGYVWDVRAGTVEVTSGEQVVVVPVAGFGSDEPPSPEAAQAHRSFVNDSFWALPCLHLVWDEGTTLEDLGTVEVPTLPDLGSRQALSLTYDPQGGGYTPGDRYVYYLGDDGFPVAWAFHRGGSDAPSFVAEWRDPSQVQGLRVVSQYWGAGGAINLQITGVEVEPAQEAAPTSRPASRPTEAGD